MAIISFPSLGDRSEAALFCLEVFLHFFGFNFEAGLAVEDASLCFVGDLASQGHELKLKQGQGPSTIQNLKLKPIVVSSGSEKAVLSTR